MRGIVPDFHRALASSVCVALFAALLMGCSPPQPAIPQLEGGVLDLRGIDFGGGRRVPLTGLWHFFPGSVDIPLDELLASHPALRKVPDLWHGSEAGGTRGHGSATYHLTVLLPPHAPPLAFHYLSASTAFRIEVGGKNVVQVGVPSSDPLSAKAAYKPGFVRIGDAGERMEIVIRVSNYVYRTGGLWFPIFLGAADAIESTHLSELAVTIAQVVGLAVMGFFLFVLFFLRRKERGFLFVGLLALDLALRGLVTGQYFITQIWPGIPFEVMIKAEYISMALATAAGTVFFTTVFPEVMERWLKLACLLPSLAYSGLAIVLPLDLLTRSLIVYQGLLLLIILVISVTAFAKTVLRPDPDGIVLFIGAAILGASAVNDIFYSSFVWWTGNLTPWGFLIFIGFQVVVMARRMTTAFAGVEELLMHKEFLIKEIHHRVKNSLQVVSSLISLQASRVADSETKEVFGLLRQRIASMGLVHEKLYGKAASDKLDLGSYLDDLVKLLVSKDSLEAGRVNLKLATQTIEVDADSCFNAGLIVTELISNSMKHALLPRGGGELKVTMTGREGTVVVRVEDDGPGFAADFEAASANSLGYKLVSSLVKTNGGRLSILPGPGGRVEVELRRFAV